MNSPVISMDSHDHITSENICEVSSSILDKTMIHIPMQFLSIVDGFNPRRYRDADSFRELFESVKKQGVQQPIIARPNDEGTGFEVVAGHGRYIANEKAGKPDIPAIVRRIDHQEALSLALLENIIRADMSVIEEAEAARRMLSLVEGDRNETARVLGWDIQRLERRLLLLHCEMKVRDALIHKRIKLGHAELLAGLAPEMQIESLDAIISKSISVSDFKSAISRYAYQISDAIFDVSSCSMCINNSSQTTDLFDESLSGGQCMNRECFDTKTKAALSTKAESLKETYPTVLLDTESDPKDRAYLAKTGDSGIGEIQYSACKGCNHYGALVHSAKGREGRVEEGICFKTSCHSKMVSTYIETLKPVPVKLVDKVTNPISKKAPSKITTAKTSATPKRVMEYAEKVHLEMATKAVVSNSRLVRVFTVKTLYDKYAGYGSVTDKTLIGRVLQKHPHIQKALKSSEGKSIELLSSIDDPTLDLVISALAGSIAGEKTGYSSDTTYVKNARAALKANHSSVENEWCVCEEYLKTLTISGLEYLAKESGFDKWYDNTKGDAAFLKVLNNRRDVIIETLLTTGFTWQGFVPSVMQL